jgi:ABC-type lipoprotein export system ATPase subunit
MTLIVRDMLFHYEAEGQRTSRAPLDLTGYALPLPSHGTVALLGESGSGKSTLLNVLGLLWDKGLAQGTVSFDGEEKTLQDLPGPDQARLRREEFGFVFQSSYLLPHFTVRQNISVPLELAGIGRAEQQRRVDALLDEAGLRPLAEKPARELSGGERQRAAILRAIVHDPRLVFADEPASNLDRQNEEMVLALLAHWRDGKLDYQAPRRGRTLFLVSHSLRQVRRVRPDHLLLLFEGKVVGECIQPSALEDDEIYDAIERGAVPAERPEVISATGGCNS